MTDESGVRSAADADAPAGPDADDGSPNPVEALASRVDALSRQVGTLRDQLHKANEDRASLRDEVEELREANATLREDVERLDERTDLLELVESADSMDAEQRATALVQHLRRAAERERERGREARASVNRDEAEAALHHPDVDRTTIYDDMRRAANLVGDESLLWYDGSSGGESRLKLDLEAGDLPSVGGGRSGSHGGA